MRVALVGECMFEIRAVHDSVDDMRVQFGGDSVSTAVYLSRMVRGSYVEWWGPFGCRIGRASSCRQSDYVSRCNNSRNSDVGSVNDQNCGKS